MVKGPESQNQYDIIVVGAGMVGAALACLLAKGQSGLCIGATANSSGGSQTCTPV